MAPAVIEDRIRAHPLIGEVMVVGDRKPFIACLVTIDEEFLPKWLELNGRPAAPLDELRTDPQLLAAVQEAVDEGNKAVSHAEAVKKFHILRTEFTEANGYLTPSLKLKRGVVLKDFAAEIESLYQR